MTPQLKAAIIRSLFQAFGMGAVTFLTTWSATDDWKVIAITTGLSFLGPLGFRGAAEGLLDSQRAAQGDVKRSDVGWAIAMGHQEIGQPVRRKPTVFDVDADGTLDT